jgi:hypothetical protein
MRPGGGAKSRAARDVKLAAIGSYAIMKSMT